MAYGGGGSSIFGAFVGGCFGGGCKVFGGSRLVAAVSVVFGCKEYDGF